MSPLMIIFIHLNTDAGRDKGRVYRPLSRLSRLLPARHRDLSRICPALSRVPPSLRVGHVPFQLRFSGGFKVALEIKMGKRCPFARQQLHVVRDTDFSLFRQILSCALESLLFGLSIICRRDLIKSEPPVLKVQALEISVGV